METKEKANELVSKFTFFSIPEDSTPLPNPKQCALICVDEMIDNGNLLINPFASYLKIDSIKTEMYWQEVKQEINKL